jgi:membrane-associated phospholipid phosphatase
MTKSSLIFWRILTWTGRFPFYLLVIILSFFVPNSSFLPRTMIASGVAWGMSTLLKKIIRRPRPFEVLRVKAWTRAERGESFPSSHAAAGFAWAVTLLQIQHPLFVVVFTWSCVVMLSRYVLHVHYASDLVVGAVLGGICSYILSLI